jgi:hypothetical protein
VTKVIKTSIDPETLEQLKQIYIDADKDVNKFKTLLEKWFEETMARASGWYKKNTQRILFFIGLGIAITFNADTIAIYNILSKDKNAREQFVNLASSALVKYDSLNTSLKKIPLSDSTYVIDSNSTGGVDSSLKIITRDTIYLSDTSLNDAKKMLIADINDANNILGLGRVDPDNCSSCKKLVTSVASSNLSPDEKEVYLTFLKENKAKFCRKNCQGDRKWLQHHPLQQGGLVTIGGWFLMALGISLGAPFWFDMLNKIMSVRGGGNKPKEIKTEEKQD